MVFPWGKKMVLFPKKSIDEKVFLKEKIANKFKK